MREDVGQDPESAMAQRPLDTVALDRYWQQAQRWVGALPKQTSWSREYWQSMQPVPLGSELDLESSLEADPFLHSFWIQTQIPRGTAVSLCMDASMSIAGEKKEWSALALASFLLLFQALPHRVVFFESTARTFDEKATFRDVLASWLSHPFGGTTHLEAGLEHALEMEGWLRRRSRKVATVLVTDGKYTTGRNPIYLGNRFGRLFVFGLGGDLRGAALCGELAHRGHGEVYQVLDMAHLPQALARLARQLNR